jgi:hypothetical protein
MNTTRTPATLTDLRPGVRFTLSPRARVIWTCYNTPRHIRGYTVVRTGPGNLRDTITFADPETTVWIVS